MILSRERHPVVVARAKKLCVPCLHGVESKWPLLKKKLTKLRISPKEVCFVGNDLNDMECLQNVGLAIAVADADDRICKKVDYVTKACGGMGAVREICEIFLYAKNAHPYF